MSALGQKQTCAVQKVMSALTPKADIASALAAPLGIVWLTLGGGGHGSSFNAWPRNPVRERRAHASP